MSVPILFALVGSVILVGFLTNLLFRITKIPSVLLLIAIGVVLGPVTGWIPTASLLPIAPYFGAAALLVILFEGGLELEIAHVVRHAPRTALLALTVFALSFAAVAALAHTFLGFSLLNALMLGAILGATSPAICMPVVAGMSVRDDVKTVIKLESVMGEVLLIVTVVLLIESHTTGATDASGWIGGFAQSLLVALAISSVAGVLWSRLVGWMGREPLSYMLTLGMVCLLYFAVEELGGSTAIAVLLFGLILANMQPIAGRFGQRFRELFGIDVREEQFVLNQFMVNITAELSFLVRTFFFVYLGLLLDFSALSWSMGGWIVAMFGLLLISRYAGIVIFRRGSSFNRAELRAIMALQPRGLATAVVAFLPVQAGVAGTELFPLYAFVMIVLSNLYMTGGVLLAERELRMTKGEEVATPEAAAPAAWPPTEAATMPEPAPAPPAPFPPPTVTTRTEPSLFSPAAEFADEPPPLTFTDVMARFFGVRRADRELEYAEMIRASYLSEPLFWVQSLLGAAICALGLILNQTAIVIGGALIVPLVRPVIATGLALASGDIYLLVKLFAKLLGFSVMVVVMSAVMIDLLPFGVTAVEIVGRTKPTILDFLVALFGGMSGAALISLRRRTFSYLPGAVIAITLLPALCVMGFGLGDTIGGQVLRGGGLQFTANLFAAVLGAAIILMLVGIPQAAQAPSIQQWKEQELTRPFAKTFFGRLRLEHALGRTGSLRARLIVVGVFLLSLLIPLQLAFNQLKLEFQTRQAIARAQAVFDVPGRSTVINSSFRLGEELIDVRLQVATNELFTAEDIVRFEERVSDQSGRRARLDLVQTVSDVGRADTIRRLLGSRTSPAEAAPAARSVAESLRDVGTVVDRILAELPLPAGLQVVSVRAGLAGERGEPGIDLMYLAEAELGADAREMVQRLLAQRVRVDDERVALQWVPGAFAVRLSRTGQVLSADADAPRTAGALLARQPGLEAALELPAGLSARARSAAVENIQRGMGVADLPVVDGQDTGEARTAIIRVRVRRGEP